MFRWLAWEFDLPSDLANILSFMFELAWGGGKRFDFLLLI